MEDIGSSPAKMKFSLPFERSRMVLAPKAFFISPFFAAQPQTGERKVTVGNRHYHIGGFNPLDPTCHPPALDVRHARVIFSLLSFRLDSLDKTQLIRFSFNQLCQRYASSNGGRYSRAIKKTLSDLTRSFIRITNIETGIAHTYRLIERMDIEERPIRRKDAKLAKSPQLEMWFNSCTLSPEFAGLLSDIEELQHLKFDVFNSIRAPLAQAIYLYIPSRAHYYTERKPFEITLKTLLQQVSATVPEHKSRRKELFTKNRTSILKQLDGLETLHGHFRVRIAETNDGTDYKLQTWVEKSHRQHNRLSGKSKLVAAWVDSGRTQEDLRQRLARVGSLDGYELDLLERAAVRIAGSEPFFRLAKAMLLPTRFIELLAEAKVIHLVTIPVAHAMPLRRPAVARDADEFALADFDFIPLMHAEFVRLAQRQGFDGVIEAGFAPHPHHVFRHAGSPIQFPFDFDDFHLFAEREPFHMAVDLHDLAVLVVFGVTFFGFRPRQVPQNVPLFSFAQDFLFLEPFPDAFADVVAFLVRRRDHQGGLAALDGGDIIFGQRRLARLDRHFMDMVPDLAHLERLLDFAFGNIFHELLEVSALAQHFADPRWRQAAEFFQQVKRLPALDGMMLSRVGHQQQARPQLLRQRKELVGLPGGEQPGLVHEPHRAVSLALQPPADQQMRDRLGIFETLLAQSVPRGFRRRCERDDFVHAAFNAPPHFVQQRGLARAGLARNPDHPIARGEGVLHRVALLRV